MLYLMYDIFAPFVHSIIKNNRFRIYHEIMTTLKASSTIRLQSVVRVNKLNCHQRLCELLRKLAPSSMVPLALILIRANLFLG